MNVQAESLSSTGSGLPGGFVSAPCLGLGMEVSLGSPASPPATGTFALRLSVGLSDFQGIDLLSDVRGPAYSRVLFPAVVAAAFCSLSQQKSRSVVGSTLPQTSAAPGSVFACRSHSFCVSLSDIFWHSSTVPQSSFLRPIFSL